ncbi:hypothetical protein BDW59DRAFT_165685 [Aspergillus cavernicola]|uniref:Uncharacterized protein n=1 Tax=Aspergillus cavernicola TaxID=176166 RepID=A0ABR4HS64_9EURO
MDLAVLCDSEVQSPFATAIHLLVGLFIIASYIPQFIRITTTSAGTTGISGWYIILLTTSATSHFAARIKNLNTSFAWGCFRRGDLQGFNAFSALVIYLQAFIHWAAAITLLAFYVYFRNDAHSSPSSSPSNPVILGIVLTHAAIVIPPAIYLLQLIIHEDHPDFDVILGLNSIYGIFLRFLGILTSESRSQGRSQPTKPRPAGHHIHGLSWLAGLENETAAAATGLSALI